jgi:hypothetical protein
MLGLVPQIIKRLFDFVATGNRVSVACRYSSGKCHVPSKPRADRHSPPVDLLDAGSQTVATGLDAVWRWLDALRDI